MLLGLIVEQVTGRPLGEVITTEIIERLGLQGTSYPTSAEMPDPHPTAYLPEPSAVSNESTNFTTPTTDIMLGLVTELYPEALRP